MLLRICVRFILKFPAEGFDTIVDGYEAPGQFPGRYLMIVCWLKFQVR
jgi:hypothetical protein